MTDNRQSENAALIEVMKELGVAEVREFTHPENENDRVPIAFIPGKKPTGLKELFDEYRTRPEALTGTAKLFDLDSLIQHAQAFSKENKESALFANPSRQSPTLTAIYDYQTSEKPSFARHRAKYEFQLSDQWKAWSAISGKAMKQDDFAHFLESHLEDVIAVDKIGPQSLDFLLSLILTPSGPAGILEISKGLSVVVNQQVTAKVNSTTGEKELLFSEEHRDTGGNYKPVIPSAFVIAIPVFLLGDPWQIAVRIQYRIEGGRVSWFLTLLRTEHVFDAAFRGACEKAKEVTDLPLYYGIDEKAG